MNIPYPFILISLKMAEVLLIDLHLPDLWDEGGPSVLRGGCTEWGHGTAGQPLLGGVRTAAPTCGAAGLPRVHPALQPVCCCNWYYDYIMKYYITDEIGI